MPAQFKDLYPTTRVIIDCTEFPKEKPSDPDTQRTTWSTYKNRSAFKLLVGVRPSGAIIFLSSLFGGSISDNEITLSSGILNKLDEGDSLMADKGFMVESHYNARKVELSYPTLSRQGFSTVSNWYSAYKVHCLPASSRGALNGKNEKFPDPELHRIPLFWYCERDCVCLCFFDQFPATIGSIASPPWATEVYACNFQKLASCPQYVKPYW